jgi:hypothetical protein
MNTPQLSNRHEPRSVTAWDVLAMLVSAAIMLAAIATGFMSASQ